MIDVCPCEAHRNDTSTAGCTRVYQIKYLLVSYTSLGLGARGWLLQRMRSLDNVLFIYLSPRRHASSFPSLRCAGQNMVQQRGIRALFVGMVPRLLQQVPSSTICWWSVEACQKALEPFAAPGSPPAGGGH